MWRVCKKLDSVDILYYNHIMTPRIGFCCKWIDHPEQIDGFHKDDPARAWNTRTTTVAWLNRQTQDAAEQRLWELMEHNIRSIRLLVDKVGALDEGRRMVRLGSDILPVYTEPTWSYFWRQANVRDYCERNFAPVGEAARRLGVRLSFHPGQFCVLASHHDSIVERSIEEFEYHADMARWMGFGLSFQDFKINVHIAGRRGAEGIIDSLQRLSPEARLKTAGVAVALLCTIPYLEKTSWWGTIPLSDPTLIVCWPKASLVVGCERTATITGTAQSTTGR